MRFAFGYGHSRGLSLARAFLMGAALWSAPIHPALADDQTPDASSKPASAKSASAKPDASSQPASGGSLDENNLRLRGLRETIDAGIARRNALAVEVAGLESDHAKLAATLIATTKTVRDDEMAVADAETRLATLDERERATKRSLDSRRAIVGKVLAALQRMGRKPPPALLVDPDDVLKAIRTSMLLGAVLPGMRAETEALLADLTDLARTRKAIGTESERLAKEVTSLGRESERLSVLVDARQAALGKAHGDMEAERDKAKQLAGEAGSLKDLIGRMEQANTAAAAAARTSDETLSMTPNVKPGVAPFKDPVRLAPAVAFNATKGLLPLPVAGTRLRGFGEDDGLGGTEKGMLVATRAGAIVAAPADGWVAFAGPYRGFGELVILNAGAGYYIVLAGMERINVDLSQFVLAGEPIAVMGEGSTKTAAAIALGAAQPVLYVEFRKDGATIDPGPWWAKPELQKVRG